MSNPKNEQEQLELETRSLEEAIQLGEALKRLQRNADFKKVITKGYLEKKILDSASLLAVPQMRDQRTFIMEDLICSSNLAFFLRWIENQYEAAMNPILSDEEEEELATQADQGTVN